ncbi:MAG: hypothetical protein AAFV90_26410 [Cyanobacteria bacterium J06634_5]
MSESANDRIIRIEESAVGSAIVSGDGNTIYVIQQATEQTPIETDPQNDTDIGPNPYKGLSAFKEADADRYFGREVQIERLWQRFQSLYEQSEVPRILPILGPSGCGKSSLARAGFIPELARKPLPGKEHMHVAVLVPGARPLEALAGVLAKAVTGDPFPLEKTEEFERGLKKQNEGGGYEGLRRIANLIPNIRDTPLVILVDQFEEAYSLCQDTEHRQAFIDNLLHAASEPTGEVSVVITLRSDFLGETQRHPLLNQVIGSDQSAFVPAMTTSELQRAIAEPAKQAGHPFNEATIDLLVKDTEGREGALPLLQFSLAHIWDGLSEGKTPANTYREMGGVGGALVGKAQQLYENLDKAQQDIARRVFLGLVQLGHGYLATRRRVALPELVATHDTQKAVRQVIQRFSSPEARLITLSSLAGSEIAEVTHEALIENWEEWRKWTEADRDFRMWLDQLRFSKNQWENLDNDEDLLLRGISLISAETWLHERSSDISKTDQSFIQASIAFRDRERHNRVRRKRRALLNTIAIAFPLLFIGQAVALRKARTSLLKTARQNLTTSAIRKAEEIESSLKMSKNNLDLLDQSNAFNQEDPSKISALLHRYDSDNPKNVTCIELIAPQEKVAMVNTCDRPLVASNKQLPWLQRDDGEKADFYVFSPVPHPLDKTVDSAIAVPRQNRAKIQFIVAKPLYDDEGKVRYTLAIEVVVFQLQDIAVQSLVGETVVIDPDNFIITHPDAQQIGRNISELPESARLQSVVGSVRAGNNNFIHLFRFLPVDGKEWLGGYSGFLVSLNPKKTTYWTVLTVTPIDRALYGLNEIRNVLFVLSIFLTITLIFLALYSASRIE